MRGWSSRAAGLGLGRKRARSAGVGHVAAQHDLQGHDAIQAHLPGLDKPRPCRRGPVPPAAGNRQSRRGSADEGPPVRLADSSAPGGECSCVASSASGRDQPGPGGRDPRRAVGAAPRRQRAARFLHPRQIGSRPRPRNRSLASPPTAGAARRPGRRFGQAPGQCRAARRDATDRPGDRATRPGAPRDRRYRFAGRLSRARLRLRGGYRPAGTHDRSRSDGDSSSNTRSRRMARR